MSFADDLNAQTIAVACQSAPTADVGVPTDYGDWQIGVQLLLPSEPQSLWGVAKWGQDKWTYLTWVDVTPYVRGMEWTRGASEFDGRAETGTATVTLDNTAGVFSVTDPTNALLGLVDVADDNSIISNYFGPGTVARIVCHSPTGYGINWEDNEHQAGAVTGANAWVPMITGVVESWPQTMESLGQESYVNLTFKESLSRLARVNTLALVSPVGNNETAADRIARLALAAGWQFGFIDTYADPYATLPLQSTDMAQERLAEVYVTADSVGAVVRTDRTGAILLTDYEPTDSPRGPVNGGALNLYAGDKFSIVSTPGTMIIDPEGLTVDNDDSAILNFVQYALVGSTEQTASDPVSIGRFGMVTHGRSDLIMKSDSVALVLAERLVARRARLTKRLRSIELNNFVDPRIGAALISLDVGYVNQTVNVDAADEGHVILFDTPRIDSMTHRVIPTSHGGPVMWTATINFGQQSGPYLNAHPIGLRVTVDGNVRVVMDGGRRVTN